jgi:type II secretory pathway pseudopilin PulG
MKMLNALVSMNLTGQARRRQEGYAMAALLVAMGVMAILMTAAMPVWKQAAQREKEEELVFRGQQYVHAIALFQRKYTGAFPPNVDTLVENRFLRKKFKDPITNEDFQVLAAGQAAAGAGGAPGQAGNPAGGAAPGSGGIGRGAGTPTVTATAPTTTRPGMSAVGTPGAGGIGGVMGVTSKSKEKSIRLYNGRSHYNEWAFVYQPQNQVPGGGVPGSAVPGQGTRGGRGQGNQPTVPGQGPFGGRGRGPGGPGGPGGRGFSPPPGGFNPFQPQPNPMAPPGRGRI